MLLQVSSQTTSPACASAVNYDRIALTLLGALFFGRLLYLAIFPLQLVGDEAYYWDWGRQLDVGYLSKPPLIAWLMGLASIFGGSEFAIRSIATVLGTGSLACIYLLGRDMFDGRTGLWALILIAASPANAALNLILTIDAPLLFLWTASLYGFWRSIHAERHSGPWPYLTPLLVGVGLLAKQMMLVFPLFAVAFLALHRPSRWLLRDRRFWAGALLPFLFLLPPLWWNAEHGWVTLLHTGGHFEADPRGALDILGRVAAFLAAQAALISPVTWLLLATVVIASVRTMRRLEKAPLYLLVFSAPGLLVVLLMNLRQNMNPNWPAAFYPSALVLLAAWGCGHLQLPGLQRLRSWFKPAAAVGVVLAVLTYAAPFIVLHSPLRGSDVDFTIRLSGWAELAQEVHEIRQGLENWEEVPLMTVGHRYNTSELAFYLPDQPRVYRWEEPGVVETQYEVWGLPRAEASRILIVASGRDEVLPASLTSSFESVERLSNLTIHLGDHARPYIIYLGEGWNPQRPAPRQ